MTNTNNETRLNDALYNLIDLADLDKLNLNSQTADFINLALTNEINNISRMNPDSEERVNIFKALNELSPFDVDEHIMLFRKVINNILTFLTYKAERTYEALNFIIKASNNHVSLEEEKTTTSLL